MPGNIKYTHFPYYFTYNLSNPCDFRMKTVNNSNNDLENRCQNQMPPVTLKGLPQNQFVGLNLKYIERSTNIDNNEIDIALANPIMRLKIQMLLIRMHLLILQYSR